MVGFAAAGGDSPRGRAGAAPGRAAATKDRVDPRPSPPFPAACRAARTRLYGHSIEHVFEQEWHGRVTSGGHGGDAGTGRPERPRLPQRARADRSRRGRRARRVRAAPARAAALRLAGRGRVRRAGRGPLRRAGRAHARPRPSGSPAGWTRCAPAGWWRSRRPSCWPGPRCGRSGSARSGSASAVGWRCSPRPPAPSTRSSAFYAVLAPAERSLVPCPTLLHLTGGPDEQDASVARVPARAAYVRHGVDGADLVRAAAPGSPTPTARTTGSNPRSRPGSRPPASSPATSASRPWLHPAFGRRARAIAAGRAGRPVGGAHAACGTMAR